MSTTLIPGLRALLAGVLLAGSPAAAQEQRAELRVAVPEENFRATPGGTRIAVVLADAGLSGGASEGRWREVTLEAWVPEGAVVPTTRDGRDLALGRGGGTLHAAPGGATVARGLEGFLLEEVSRREGWVRVRRTGWVWSPSLAQAPAEQRAAAPATEASPPPSATADSATRTSVPASTSASAQRRLLSAPDGDPLATIDTAARLEVLGREGEWARVRIEGWIRVPEQGGLNPSAPMTDLSLQALRENPDLYRGRSVAWRVQFVAVQRADSLRTDFAAGETYLLARDPGGEPGYVYIAVPQPLLAEARRLVPLQQVEVVGRVRTGRSQLMGHPVLELLQLRPLSR